MKRVSPQRPTLTDGPIGRQLFRLTLPMLVGILAMLGFNVVDTMFVGRLGTLPLAAMAVAFPVVMVLMSISLGIGIGTSIVVSRAIGGEHPEEVRRLTTDALSLAFLVSVLCSACGLLVLDPVIHALEGDLPTHGDTRAYLSVWLPGLAFVMLPMVGSMAIRATGDTFTPSAILLLGVLVNAMLDPLLIFGWGPCPLLEIAGAAWATVLSRAATLAAVLWLLLRRERMLTTPFVRPAVMVRSWGRLLRIAVPIALNNLITPLQIGALTRLCAVLGPAVVAGYGVGSRVESFALSGMFALQSVIGVFVGQNAGAARWGRVRGVMRACTRFGLAYGGCVFLVLLALGKPLASAFDSDTAVIGATYAYFVVAGMTFGGKAVYLSGSAGLNSLDRAGTATTVTAVHGLLIAVPAAWLGGRFWGMPGLFGGVALGNLAGGAMTELALRRVLRRHPPRPPGQEPHST